ncbi:MAG: YraN family protein [Mycobacteriales bacterium]
MRAKDGVGRYGEDVATRHLVEQGFLVLDRNWRCAEGELDIVARDGDTTVFVEVKTRSSTRFGEPAEAVSPVKARRLRALAVRWLDHHENARGRLRFDVVSVLRSRVGAAHVVHLRDAF